jgi:hypothetical protein
MTLLRTAAAMIGTSTNNTSNNDNNDSDDTARIAAAGGGLAATSTTNTTTDDETSVSVDDVPLLRAVYVEIKDVRFGIAMYANSAFLNKLRKRKSEYYLTNQSQIDLTDHQVDIMASTVYNETIVDGGRFLLTLSDIMDETQFDIIERTEAMTNIIRENMRFVFYGRPSDDDDDDNDDDDDDDDDDGEKVDEEVELEKEKLINGNKVVETNKFSGPDDDDDEVRKKRMMRTMTTTKSL